MFPRRSEVLRFVYGAMPERLLTKVVRVDFHGGWATPVTEVPEGDVRLFIGLANSAGQGWQWARAAERLPGVRAVSFTTEYGNPFGYQVDSSVDHLVYRWSRSWQRRQRRRLEGFTHVVLESGRRLLGDYFRGSTAADIAALQHAGVKVALLWHGSDIRLPSRHLENETWSPFGDAELRASLEPTAAANARLAATSGLPSFVSTPDLLLDVPDATWLPVVVDVDRWANDEPPLGSTRPVVAHAPSNAQIKGTELIDGTLARLDEAGVIRYLRVEGVAASEMPSVYRDADIVVDQFRIGNYGVAACEAMAAGRVVLSHVSDQVRDHVRDATGLQLPIVETTPQTIEQVIREVIAAPDAARAAAAAGPAFVRAVHDGRRSAAALAPFLGLAEPLTPGR